MSTVVVTGPIPDPPDSLLRADHRVLEVPATGAAGRRDLLAALDGAEVAGIVSTVTAAVDREVLAAAGPSLRVVANVAVGYDNIDVDACQEHGVLVTNTPGVLTEATADLAFALVLMVTRRLGEAERLIRCGTPWAWEMDFLLGRSLADKTFGVLGLGGIGQATARRARAFGMRVIYHSRRRADAAIEVELDARYVDIDELITTSDVLSLHAPLTPHTHHLIGADQFAAMKPTAYLVNTARGPLVDEAALVTALRTGQIAGAGLDVYEQEPQVNTGLIGLENAVLIPHLGSATVETRTAMADLAVRNVLAVLAGDPPLTPVSS